MIKTKLKFGLLYRQVEKIGRNKPSNYKVTSDGVEKNNKRPH
jgi:hypothetical protein